MARHTSSLPCQVLLVLVLCGVAQAQRKLKDVLPNSRLQGLLVGEPVNLTVPITDVSRAKIEAVTNCAVGDAKCFCATAGWGGNYAELSCKGFYGCTDATYGFYFPCQEGTLYDKNCQCCNWQSLVQCSSGGQQPNSPSPPAPITPSPPASITPSPLPPASPPAVTDCSSWAPFLSQDRWIVIRLNLQRNVECMGNKAGACIKGSAARAAKLVKNVPYNFYIITCSAASYPSNNWCTLAKQSCTGSDPSGHSTSPAPPSSPPTPSSPPQVCTYSVSVNDTFWAVAQTQKAASNWASSNYQAAAPTKPTWLLDQTTNVLQAYDPNINIQDLRLGLALDVPCNNNSPPPQPSPPPPSNPGSSLVGNYITAALWGEIFKHTGDSVCTPGFYSYNSFVQAAATFPSFASSGDATKDKRELAAFLAQVSHETTGGWPTAPDGQYAWGLCFKEEGQNSGGAGSNYCMQLWDNSWPCTPGKGYWGRGPIQISYNFNYGPCGVALGLDLLNHPELVSSDATISFRTAFWFWMTPQDPKPSCHDVMQGSWIPSANDIARGRLPGFGVVTNIINGGIECGSPNNPAVADRIGYYRRYAALLGVDVGDNLDCASQAPFTW